MGMLSNAGRYIARAKAIEKYIAYYQSKATQPSKVGQGDPKPETIGLYVHPFGTDFKATFVVSVTGHKARWTEYQSKIGTYTKTAATDVSPKIRDFRPARVVIKKLTGAKTTERSARTGLPYVKYAGKSGSIPFGRSAAGDDELDVFLDIKENFKAGGVLPADLAISRIKEKI